MKKTAPAKGKAASHAGHPKPPSAAVEAYISVVPEPTQAALRQLREIIVSEVPAEATEVISYGIPAFALRKAFFGYAAFKNYLSVLPFSGSLFSSFTEEISAYSHTKSSLHFPLNKPLPIALIRKLVRERLAVELAAEGKRAVGKSRITSPK